MTTTTAKWTKCWRRMWNPTLKLLPATQRESTEKILMLSWEHSNIQRGWVLYIQLLIPFLLFIFLFLLFKLTNNFWSMELHTCMYVQYFECWEKINLYITESIKSFLLLCSSYKIMWKLPAFLSKMIRLMLKELEKCLLSLDHLRTAVVCGLKGIPVLSVGIFVCCRSMSTSWLQKHACKQRCCMCCAPSTSIWHSDLPSICVLRPVIFLLLPPSLCVCMNVFVCYAHGQQDWTKVVCRSSDLLKLLGLKGCLPGKPRRLWSAWKIFYDGAEFWSWDFQVNSLRQWHCEREKRASLCVSWVACGARNSQLEISGSLVSEWM